MNSWQQAQNAMAFKAAHNLWFAQMISAVREGRCFAEDEPKLDYYMRENQPPWSLRPPPPA